MRHWIGDGLQDVRYAARALLRSRMFAITAVVTLATGIGATTAVFSVVNGILLRPLPFPNPERLVQLHGTSRNVAQGQQVMNLDAYRRDSTSFDAISGYDVGARYMRDAGGADRVMVVRTERDFFAVLGVQPMRGRFYDTRTSSLEVVVGEGFWKRRLGARPDAVGMPLVLDGRSFTIAGILPDEFQYPYRAASLLPDAAAHGRTDVWMPFENTPQPRSRFGNVTARLKKGISVAAAQAEVDAISRRLEAADQRNAGRGITVVPMADDVVPTPVRRLLLLLFGAVVVVLTLACANVTNLSLARTMTRQREVAVRAALGASASRLGRQFITESLVIATAGGLAGLCLAWWILRRLLVAASPYVPRMHEVTLDWRVFGFVLATCGLVALIVGVIPASIGLRRDPHAALQNGGSHATMNPLQRRVRDGLVVAEVALAFMLAVGAAVLLREFVRLRGTDAGVVSQNAITLHVGQKPGAPAGADVFYEIADRVARLPGVRAAGFAQMLPLQSWGWTSNSSDFRVRGRPVRPEEFVIELRYVTPGYFDAIGIPIRRGRAFTSGDRPDTPPVIIINETLARRAFPGEDPIGLLTTRGTVVGTIADVRQAGLDQPPAPEIYYAAAQNWSQLSELGMTLVVRTLGRPEPLIDAVRSTVRDMEPDRAVFGIKTMERVVAESLAGFRLSLAVLAAFALLAIVLALSGTYAVISYIASARTREFAIRAALGASRQRLVGHVLAQGILLSAMGLGLGVAGMLAATRIFATVPFALRPPDVVTMLPVACLIASVAAAASLVPARRAARVDPMRVLRAE